MSTRHERHEWDTNNTNATRVQHEWDTSNTSATQVRHLSALRMTQVQHECFTNDTSVARVKDFDFDNDTSRNIFLHPYIYYMAREKLQGEKQFHSKNYLSEMPRFHAKMRLKSALEKLNFLMAKDISKSYTLDCSCTLTSSHVPA